MRFYMKIAKIAIPSQYHSFFAIKKVKNGEMLLKSNFITPLLFIGVHFIYNTNVVVTFRTNLHVYNLMRHKKSMAQITAPCHNKRKPYSQNRN